MDAFVLGAGFSKAISHYMPTMDDLLEGLRNEVARHRPTLIVDERLPIENVEALLDYLATPQPFLETPENLENQALFGRIADWLRVEVYQRQRLAMHGLSAPDWLVRLIERWHLEEAAVVTLNYDTLIEAAVHNMNLRAGGDTIFSPDLYAMPIPHAAIRLWGMSYPTRMPLPSFRLIKLHGSLNWFYSGAPGYGQPMVDVGVSAWNKDIPLAWELVRDKAPKFEAFIIPPSLVKTAYFDNEIIRGLWLTARESLDQAGRLVILGYSLPAADGPMRGLLSQATRGKTVVPVDTNPAIVDHLKAMLPGAEIDGRYVGEEGAVERFVNAGESAET